MQIISLSINCEVMVLLHKFYMFYPVGRNEHDGVDSNDGNVIDEARMHCLILQYSTIASRIRTRSAFEKIKVPLPKFNFRFQLAYFNGTSYLNCCPFIINFVDARVIPNCAVVSFAFAYRSYIRVGQICNDIERDSAQFDKDPDKEQRNRVGRANVPPQIFQPGSATLLHLQK